MRPLLLALTLVLAPILAARTFTVTSTADPGDGTCDADCTLREALAEANAANGAVEFDAALASATITLAAGQLEASGDVTIDGGDRDVTVSGANASRVLYVAPGAAVEIRSLTLANGEVDTEGEAFGGNVLHEGDDLTLIDVTVRDGSANDVLALGEGGGIAAYGPLTMRGGAVLDNYSIFQGGGLYLAAPTLIEDVRIEGNEAFDDGGGIFSTAAVEVRRAAIRSNEAFEGGRHQCRHRRVASALAQRSLGQRDGTMFRGGGRGLCR